MKKKQLTSTIPSSILLTNKNGMELIVNSFGATITSLKVPNKNNTLTNVVLNLKQEQDYWSNTYLNERIYLGSTVGRYAGRISKKSFTIDDCVYTLNHDDNNVHLHGGNNGFDRKIWKIKEVEKQNKHISKVTFSYESTHLEEGFPGNLSVNATFILTDNNEVEIIYTGTSNKKTHVNITNHSYYNLNGKDSILNHHLYLNCNEYLEIDELLIPTGKILPVNNTSYDFRNSKIIGNNQFSGLDDTFILNSKNSGIVLSSTKTGIQMKISTNQPGVVIYTPLNFNHLNLNSSYSNYPAICFETQKYPDTPNNPHFPSTLIYPSEEYENKTKLSFSILQS